MTDLIERLTAILSERRLPGTRNGPITEPRDLAIHIAAKLAEPEPRPEVRIIDAGYEIVDQYRGFDIGSRGRDIAKLGVYKGGESFSMNYLPSVPHARGFIDRLIKSGFIEWFDRYTGARAEKGLKAPPSRERAAAAFHAQRQPEDLVLDDLLDASTYSVEQQQDRSWAIMHGGGFVKGGFAFREDAVADAKKRIEGDIEAGVPVVREVA
jgi:hypothetical protein